MLSGRDVATWVDRVVRGPVRPAGDPGPAASDAPEVDPRIDLRDGVVVGSGVTLTNRVGAVLFVLFAGLAGSAAGPVPAVDLESSPTPPRGSRAVPRVPASNVAAAGPKHAAAEPSPNGPVEHGAPSRAEGDTGIISIALDQALPEDELTPLPLATGEPSGADAAPGPDAAIDEQPPERWPCTGSCAPAVTSTTRKRGSAR